MNSIKQLALLALKALRQSNQEFLQQRPDAIIKNLSQEYKTLKQNVLPHSKPLFGNDLNNRITLLQVSNKACNFTITPNNSGYYQQNYSPNVSWTQGDSKNFKGFSRRTTSLQEEATTETGTSASSNAEITESDKGYPPEIKKPNNDINK